MCPCVRQQASWEAQVIKLCGIWANIYPIFNLVIKTGGSRGSSAPVTIPSASRSKATRRTRAGRRRDGSYCGRPARGVDVKLRPQIPGTDLKVLGLNISAQVARGSTVPVGCSLQATRLVSSTRRPVSSAATPRSPGRPQPGLEAVTAVLHGQAGPALYSIPITM
jgi:hypothetical protein